MAMTVMNGNDCFKNGNDCSKWQRPFTKGKIAAAIGAILKMWFDENTQSIQFSKVIFFILVFTCTVSLC